MNALILDIAIASVGNIMIAQRASPIKISIKLLPCPLQANIAKLNNFDYTVSHDI
jgi:hypothetical protein